MREMKDSGVPWIGEMPKGWRKYRIKYNTFLKGRIGWQGLNSSDFIDEGYCLITGTDFDNKGGINWDTCYRISKERFDEDEQLHVKEGDLLMTKDGTVGKMALIKHLPEEASLNSHLLIIRQITNMMTNEYLYWMMMSGVFKCFCSLYQSGSIMSSIGQGTLESFSCHCPPLEEQRRIADFLDAKCAEIDSILEKTKASIEEYRKLKQSVISKAVTKGVRGKRQMKNSGVEWIGEIPEEWTRDKVVRLFKTIGSGTTPKSSDDAAYVGSVNWIQSGDLNGGRLCTCKKQINKDTLQEYSALKLYRAPFLIIAMYGASVGNTSISTIDGCVNQACCVLKGSKLDEQYAFFAIKSIKDYLIYNAVGGGQPNIGQDTIKSSWLPVPPKKEQQEIAAYLDEKCATIDSLIASKESLISELESYKKSLIYEYVTGKKEVTESS